MDHDVLVVLGDSAAGAAKQAVDRRRTEVVALRPRDDDDALADAIVRCGTLTVAFEDDERLEALRRVLPVVAALRPELIETLGVVDLPSTYRGFGEMVPDALRAHLALGSRPLSLSDVVPVAPAEA